MLFADRVQLLGAFRSLLRPLVRLALKEGVSLRELVDSLKLLFVEEGDEELRGSGSKSNISRLSVLSGVHRKDVTRILREKAPPDPRLSVSGRILSVWENDRRFSVKGRARPLTCDGEGSEFYRLSQLITSNVGPATTLSELFRSGLIEQSRDGLIKPRSRAIVLSGNPELAFEYVGKDIESLLQAVKENLTVSKGLGSMQIRTDFDNLYRDQEPKIRKWLFEEGKEFHHRARAFLSELDADITPRTSANADAGLRISLSSFSFIDSSPSVSVGSRTASAAGKNAKPVAIKTSRKKTRRK